MSWSKGQSKVERGKGRVGGGKPMMLQLLEIGAFGVIRINERTGAGERKRWVRRKAST